jgi:hypothetical protein
VWLIVSAQNAATNQKSFNVEWLDLIWRQYVFYNKKFNTPGLRHDIPINSQQYKVVTAELKKMKKKHFTSKLTFTLRILPDRNDIDVKSSGRKGKPAKDRKLVI